MPCCEETKPRTRSAGCGCGGSRPFPWLSALCDPAMGRLFFRRFWKELAQGALAGCMAGAAALAAGDGIGALGPLLGGSWIHFHALAVAVAALPGGLVLGLLAPRWAAGVKGALVPLILGGLVNGFLEGGLAWREMITSVMAFAILGLAALGLCLGILRLAFQRKNT